MFGNPLAAARLSSLTYGSPHAAATVQIEFKTCGWHSEL